MTMKHTQEGIRFARSIVSLFHQFLAPPHLAFSFFLSFFLSGIVRDHFAAESLDALTMSVFFISLYIGFKMSLCALRYFLLLLRVLRSSVSHANSLCLLFSN